MSSEITPTDAKKLQEGIDVLTSILSRVSDSPSSSSSSSSSAASTPLSRHSNSSSGNGSSQEPTVGRALQALRSVRRHFSDDGKTEHKSNFAPYCIKQASKKKGKERLRGCTFKMFCLSSPQDNRVPCAAATKEVLLEAGLGSKTVSIPDVSCTRDEFWDIITSTYPKLSGCGGFEFLRCQCNSRDLEVISRNVSQTPKMLKAIVGNGRVFIRPLQKDLDLKPDVDNLSSSDLTEKCIYCEEEISITRIRRHAQRCKQDKRMREDEDFIHSKPLYRPRQPIVLSSSSEDDADDDKNDYDKNDDVEESAVEFGNSDDVRQTENEVMEHVLTQSARECAGDIDATRSEETEEVCLKTILLNMASDINEDIFLLSIRRQYVLVDALRATKWSSFSCYKTIKVNIVATDSAFCYILRQVKFLEGESGDDGGGPSREFWRLLGKDIQQSMCEGPTNKVSLRHDSLGLKDKKFYRVGQLMAMGIVQKNSYFPFFAKPVYDYLCGIPLETIHIGDEEVPDYEARALIESIQNADSIEALRDACLEQADLIIDSGYSKPVSTIAMHEKSELVSTIKIHFTLLRCKAELDQLKSGLSVLRVGNAICAYTEMFSPFFIHGKVPPLSAECIRALFTKTVFSPPGSSERAKEESTYMMFLDYLHTSEDMDMSRGDIENSVSLGEVLSFFSGGEHIPPLGFDNPPVLRFSSTEVFPKASTCAIELTLPTKYHADPEAFQYKMTYALKNHGGYGLN